MGVYSFPLYRSTVGFDCLASMLDEVASFDNQADTCPPYNIERLTENTTSSASPRMSTG
jgi:molecular chaperone IbpA